MTPTIEAQGLKKRYGKTHALNGLDLVAERGQVMAVLGPNGAGKTTFVRAVATLLALDEGMLRVAGHDVRRDPGAVRRVIGLAGQFAAVEPAMSGRENLQMVARLFGQDRRAARRSADAVLEQLDLVEAADRLARTRGGLRSQPEHPPRRIRRQRRQYRLPARRSSTTSLPTIIYRINRSEASGKAASRSRKRSFETIRASSSRAKERMK